MNLKIGGSNVGKIMYNGQEIGGATKLEPGTILCVSNSRSPQFKDAHLFSTTNNWSNIDGINIEVSLIEDIHDVLSRLNISGDDFKNLDIEKKYKLLGVTVTVSRSTVDGEYRLNVLGYNATNENQVLVIKAI